MGLTLTVVFLKINTKCIFRRGFFFLEFEMRKKQSRKTLSILLSVVMLMSAIPAQAFAEEAERLSAVTSQVQTVLSGDENANESESVESEVRDTDQNIATPPLRQSLK